MKIIIIIILTLFSISIGQNKMILKSGKEIVLSADKNRGICKYCSEYGDEEYRDIIGKATADAKTSSQNFKNINQKLLDGLNEEQKKIYLRAFGNPNSSPMRTFGIFACVFTLLITSLILQSPSFWAAGLG